MNILPGLFSEDQVAERFGVSVRVVREHACAKRIGSKFSRKRYFTEADIQELMKGGKATCSDSSNGRARKTFTRAGRTSGSAFSKALELATEGKPKPSSPGCKTTSSKGKRVVAFSLSRGS